MTDCTCSASKVDDCDGTHEPNCPLAFDYEEPWDGRTREGRIVAGDVPADAPWGEEDTRPTGEELLRFLRLTASGGSVTPGQAARLRAVADFMEALLVSLREAEQALSTNTPYPFWRDQAKRAEASLREAEEAYRVDTRADGKEIERLRASLRKAEWALWEIADWKTEGLSWNAFNLVREFARAALVGGDEAKERCPSKSPIYKFDEGPRQCRHKKGHTGPHGAKTSDGAYVHDLAHDYWVSWEDES